MLPIAAKKKSGKRFGLVDEHDGDIILDFVKKPATITNESLFFGIKSDIPLALRASENIQQFLTDGHIEKASCALYGKFEWCLQDWGVCFGLFCPDCEFV